MTIKLLSLSKNEDFKSLLTGRKVSSKYLTIFFKNLSYKGNKNLNISFVAQKKIGNAVKRNKIKRRLKNITNDALKKTSLNFNYSYLVVAKKTVLNDNYEDIKETLFSNFKKIR